MLKKRYLADEIIPELQEVDVLLSRGEIRQPGVQADRYQRSDLPSLAQELRRGESRSGQTRELTEPVVLGPEKTLEMPPTC